MRLVTQQQIDILNGAPGSVATLMRMDHPDGILRFSTLGFNWEDAGGISWTGAYGVIDAGDPFTKMGVKGGAIEVRWTGATSGLMEAAQHPKLIGSKFWRSIAFLDENSNQVGGQIIDFVGYCQKPRIKARRGVITMQVESRLIRLRRRREVRMTPGDHQKYFPGDTGFDFVAGLQSADPFGKEGLSKRGGKSTFDSATVFKNAKQNR